jgi:hypothetical protein
VERTLARAQIVPGLGINGIGLACFKRRIKDALEAAVAIEIEAAFSTVDRIEPVVGLEIGDQIIRDIDAFCCGGPALRAGS